MLTGLVVIIGSTGASPAVARTLLLFAAVAFDASSGL